MNEHEHVRGRYAPSPTGPLHLGNVRTALIAWLQVRLVGGTFVMRMEDLDRPRNVEGSAEEILDDLHWLGLDWDEGPDLGGPFGPYNQSERDAIYEDALARLDAVGKVFPCWCSRKDIAEASSAPHHATSLYPGTCRDLTAEEIAAVQARKPDRDPSWRYRTTEGGITVQDEVLGSFTQNLVTDVGDFVLRRADDMFSYQIAVVVDDIEMGITDVVRGADLLDSTPRQVALYRALGAPPPRFWHVPLMHDEEGERMSKRNAAKSLRSLREEGWTPQRVVGRLAASLGWCEPNTAISAADLLADLSQSGSKPLLQTGAEPTSDRFSSALRTYSTDGS